MRTHYLVIAITLALAVSVLADNVSTMRIRKTKKADIPRHQILRSLSQKYRIPLKPEVVERANNLPLGGNVYPIGIYYVEIDIGTPGRSFNVAIDTGSCSLLVPATGCQGCPPVSPNHTYDPNSSSTSSPVSCDTTSECSGCSGTNQCQFYNSYQTCNLSNPNQVCSVGGLIYSDVFVFGPGLKGSVNFGTITQQTPNFQQFAVIDGVFGLACTQDFGQPTPLESMVQAGLIQDQFSFCFDKSGQGGLLTFGGADPNLYTGTFQYTPLTQGIEGEYYVSMNDLLVAGQSIGVDPIVYSGQYGGAIVDSGTNVFLLPHEAFRALRRSFMNMCSKTTLRGVCDAPAGQTLFDGFCFGMSSSDLAKFPPMTVVLQGPVELKMTPANYLTTQNGPGQYCLGVIDTGYGGFTILGDTNMAPYVSLFDRVNTQLGFAPVNAANCVA
jgi:hypothetical protein